MSLKLADAKPEPSPFMDGCPVTGICVSPEGWIGINVGEDIIKLSPQDAFTLSTFLTAVVYKLCGTPKTMMPRIQRHVR